MSTNSLGMEMFESRHKRKGLYAELQRTTFFSTVDSAFIERFIEQGKHKK